MNILNCFLFTLLISNIKINCAYVNKRTIVNKTFLFSKKSKADFFADNYKPKNSNQQLYVKFLNDRNYKIIVAIGPAGTGKTMFACQKAVKLLKTEEINKIVITRPVVTVEEEIGFLPGNIVKKMDPWTKPIFDTFLEQFSKTELDLMLYNGKVEICPLGFMRGRTFKNSFIIADEMQNSSPNQMKMLTTRIGDNSRMIITGDLKQTDISKDNGLNDFVFKLNTYKHNINTNFTDIIQLVEFNNTDIERSEIVKRVIDIYDYNLLQTPNTILNPITNLVLNNKSKIIKKRKSIDDNNDAALMPHNHYYRQI